MSRSHRKSPVLRSGGDESKKWKTRHNRILRRRNRNIINHDYESENFFDLRQVSDILLSPRDHCIVAWNYFRELGERMKRKVLNK